MQSWGKRLPRPRQGGLRVFWIDEAHFTTKTKLGHTWLARGLSVMCKIKPYGKRRACFAALGAGGTIHHRYYDRGNTQYMIDFVRSIRKKYGKALLVMDNTSYHKSRALMKEIETYGGDIRLEYLPAYLPDLNPVEMVWKELKKYIANGIYPRGTCLGVLSVDLASTDRRDYANFVTPVNDVMLRFVKIDVGSIHITKLP